MAMACLSCRNLPFSDKLFSWVIKQMNLCREANLHSHLISAQLRSTASQRAQQENGAVMGNNTSGDWISRLTAPHVILSDDCVLNAVTVRNERLKPGGLFTSRFYLKKPFDTQKRWRSYFWFVFCLDVRFMFRLIRFVLCCPPLIPFTALQWVFTLQSLKRNCFLTLKENMRFKEMNPKYYCTYVEYDSLQPQCWHQEHL